MGAKVDRGYIFSATAEESVPKFHALPNDAETSHRPLLHLDVSGRSSQMRSYGATQNVPEGPSATVKTSPERYRRDSLLNKVPEEEVLPDNDADAEELVDEELEWGLEQNGLYKGSYKRLMTLYTLVPLSSILVFAILAALPFLVWRSHPPTLPRPRYFAFPIPELLVSASLWTLSHHLRLPIYSLSSLLARAPTSTIILSTTLHVLIHNILRLSALPLLRVRHQMTYPIPIWNDAAFYTVWWIALGWALADVVVGITQGFEQIVLYKDVLIPEGRAQEFLKQRIGEDEVRTRKRTESNGHSSHSPPSDNLSPRTITIHDIVPRVSGGYVSPRETFTPPTPNRNITKNNIKTSGGSQKSSEHEIQLLNTAIGLEVEQDLERLLSFKAREELEEVYGIPVIKIPVFVSCLQRINSVILSLGLTLLLSASYLYSTFSLSISNSLNHSSTKLNDAQPSLDLHPILGPNPHGNPDRPFYITFPIVLALQIFLSLLHAPPVLPRIGMHVASYVGLLVGLGCLFAGLAMWGALS